MSLTQLTWRSSAMIDSKASEIVFSCSAAESACISTLQRLTSHTSDRRDSQLRPLTKLTYKPSTKRIGSEAISSHAASTLKVGLSRSIVTFLTTTEAPTK